MTSYPLKSAFLSVIILLPMVYLSSCQKQAFADNNRIVVKAESYAGYSLNQWCNAIHKAEGNDNYGILSVKCTEREGCKKICKNTVKNNYKRWKKSKSNEPFIRFLANRYCPVGASNDPTGLNRNWKNNVKYYLENGEQNEK